MVGLALMKYNTTPLSASKALSAMRMPQPHFWVRVLPQALLISWFLPFQLSLSCGMGARRDSQNSRSAMTSTHSSSKPTTIRCNTPFKV